MEYSAIAGLIITLALLFAGMVKGVIGMGLPAIAMGLLVLFMPPVQAAALLVVPCMVTNIWQLAAGPSFVVLVKRFSTMLLTIVLGTFAGIGLLTGGGGALATAILGAVLAAYAIFGLRATRFVISNQTERWLSPVVGLFTGILTGATGVSVIPTVPYFSSLGLQKEDLIQTLGLSFTVSTLALAIALLANGKFDSTVAASSLLALVPVLGGMFLGQRVRNRLKPELFRRWFFIGLLILGPYMVVRALGAI